MRDAGWRVTGLHHVAIAHADDPVCEDALASLIGPPGHAEEGPGFLERMYELGPSYVQTLEATGDGVVRRFLDKRGPGLHHIAFEVQAIDEALVDLDRRGVPLIDREARSGGMGTRIAFLHPAAFGGVLVELVGGTVRERPGTVRRGRGPMADLSPDGTTNASPVFTARPDRRKMTDWVWEEIREAIIELRLRPGEPLREVALAEQLGVSKTPLREAFARLEQEGLVETTSFKGAVVTGYSERDLREIYELRTLLEGAAARAAAERSTDETLEALLDLVDRSRDRRDAGDLVELAGLLEQFDLLVYAQVSNVRIAALIENLRAHLTRIGKLTESIPGRVEASVEEHAAIVDAIASHDPDEAERLMRVHIGSVLSDQLAMRGAPDAGVV